MEVKVENKYENVSFEGGGCRGIAYAGAIQALEDLGIRRSLKRFTGSSIGSLYASLFALNVPVNKIKEITLEIDIKKVRSKSCFIKKIYNLFTHYGQDENELLSSFVKWTFKKSEIDPEITFQQNYEKTGNELFIPGTNVNKHKVYFFSHYTHPDMNICHAVSISMCVPMIYTPFYLDGDMYVDAGIAENYPIYIFNDLEKLKQGKIYEIDREPINQKTLGIKLLTRDETNSLDVFHGRVITPNIYSVIMELVNTMALQVESGDISESYIKQTIAIHNLGDSLFELDRPREEIIEIGKQAIYKYFEKNENKTENEKKFE